MSTSLASMALRINPFDPAGSGPPPWGPTWLPESWQTLLTETLDRLSQAGGSRALALSAEYGGGKTYALEWLAHIALPQREIVPYYFNSPGVQFYDLANALLRQVGRKEFSKSLWELAAMHVQPLQRSLLGSGFEAYLGAFSAKKGQQHHVLADLQAAIQKAGITQDEEIANRLARIAIGTPIKPYFEYRDFVGGRPDSLVAEREEAPYFKAILTVLRLARNSGIALLLDEFEEISLQKRMSRREAHDYLSTLRRLINLTQDQNLWVVAALHPNAVQETVTLEPSLWQRFTGNGSNAIRLPPFREEDAASMVEWRLGYARPEGVVAPSSLFPFPDDFPSLLPPSAVSSPRKLVQICFCAISTGGEADLPFSRSHLEQALHFVVGENQA